VAVSRRKLPVPTYFGFWAGVPILIFLFAANALKLYVNLRYLYSFPDAQVVGVDPITGFVFGLTVTAAASYMLKGLRTSSVWAAVGLIVTMPLLYVLMVDGLVAAELHIQTYFVDNTIGSFELEVIPACALVVLYGAQALVNYRQRFRKLR
jgi:hypothetical protein